MKTIRLGNSSLVSSRLAYGCWRVTGSWNPAEVTADSLAAGRLAVRAAYEAGYTLFDLADIYCRGRCEELFGEVLREISGMRERVLVATKCGIRRAGEPAPPSRHHRRRRFVPAAVATLQGRSRRRLSA